MVQKFVLYISADLDNLTDLQPRHGVDDPGFTYRFQLKCNGCNMVSDITLSLNKKIVELKCNNCDSQGSISMDPGRGHPLTIELSQKGEPAPLMAFYCQGFEPLEFEFGGGWKADSLQGTKFFSVDLAEGVFQEFDNKGCCNVKISNLHAEFKADESNSSTLENDETRLSLKITDVTVIPDASVRFENQMTGSLVKLTNVTKSTIPPVGKPIYTELEPPEYLPAGWKYLKKTQVGGKHNGRASHVYEKPGGGTKFKSWPEVQRYIAQNGGQESSNSVTERIRLKQLFLRLSVMF